MALRPKMILPQHVAKPSDGTLGLKLSLDSGLPALLALSTFWFLMLFDDRWWKPKSVRQDGKISLFDLHSSARFLDPVIQSVMSESCFLLSYTSQILEKKTYGHGFYCIVLNWFSQMFRFILVLPFWIQVSWRFWAVLSSLDWKRDRPARLWNFRFGTGYPWLTLTARFDLGGT